MKKNIVITVLVLLVVGLGCFIVYDKVISKDEKKGNDSVEQTTNNNSENDKTEITTSDIVVANNLLSNLSINPCGGGYKYDIDVNDTLYYNDLTDDVKFSMAYYNLYKRQLVERVYTDELLESYNYVFGKRNHSLPSLGIPIYLFANYELKNNVYELTANGGGCGISLSKYVLDNIEKAKNEMFIDVLYVFLEYEDVGVNTVYLSPNYGNENTKIKVSSMNISGEDIKEALKNDRDKFIKYRFTFKENDDHYIFDSIKRVN